MEEESGECASLHHYTNTVGLQGILTCMELWASEATFLNDRSELARGREGLVEALEELIQELSEAPEPNSAGYRIAVAHSTIDLLQKADSTEPDQPRIFVTCFCKQGDLLSQWRSYSRGGYALGFSAEGLERTTTKEIIVGHQPSSQQQRGVKLRPVKYVAPHERPRPSAEDLERIIPPGSGSWNRGPGFLQAGWDALEYVATFKLDGLREEQEHRLIYALRSDRDRTGGGCDAERVVQFRESPRSLVPFIRLSFPGEALTHVVVGPSSDQDLRVRALRHLVEELELPIEVRRSALSYRP